MALRSDVAQCSHGRLRGAFGRALGAERVLDLFLRSGPHRLSVAKP